jgi:hypothetical protein
VTLDGQSLGSLPAGVHDLVRDADGRWKPTIEAQPADKSCGRPGKAADILTRNFVVVYGTGVTALTPILRERAYDVARQVAGTRKHQWAGRVVSILSDEEAKGLDLGSRDVVLIGTAEQNGATKALGGQLPAAIQAILAGLPSASAPGRVFQGIFPQAKNPSTYLYLEAGADPSAYTGPIVKKPDRDFSVSRNELGWKTEQGGDFDREWKLAGPIVSAR